MIMKLNINLNKKIGIVMMITIMIIIIEKDLTSRCNNKKKLDWFFDNVTKQLRFKNSARVLTLSFPITIIIYDHYYYYYLNIFYQLYLLSIILKLVHFCYIL